MDLSSAIDATPVTLEARRRHDPRGGPAVPIIASVAALVLADLALIPSIRE